ncbi:MAG: AAA family ATPase [Gammaproteobacteria bacterium]|nr:AAA family ATPase [Gammaproteobacteria bacterium]
MADPDRGFLGLTHNPFIQADDSFFERGGRLTQLEQLRQPSRWSRRVLLVTGLPGVGKSVLYRQSSSSLEPGTRAARINGSLINTRREVLMSVAQGFGVAAPTDSNTQLLNDMISSHVVEQAAKERTSVVLIDDAEMLEPRAIDDLLDLVDSSSLHIVFFGEVRIVPAVERAAARFAIEWQEIRLTGFGEADARDYLEWCFQQAQYRGRLPFTDQQVKEVVKLSEGLPGRINQLANVLLVKLETGGSDDGNSKFPGLHRAILFLVVAVLGLTYLLWRQNEEAAEQAKLAVVANPVAQTLPAPANNVAQETADEGAAEGVETAPVADEPAAAPQVADEAAGNDGARSDAHSDATDLQPKPVARSAPEPVTQTTQSEPDPPAPPPARPQTDAVQPQPSLGAEVQLTDAVPASRGRDAAWLLRQPVNAFTLQLLTVSTHERAVAFVNGQEYPEQFAVYRLQRDGRLLFVVVYGLFDSRDEAQSVAVNLPESISKISPWARPLGQIQDAIRTTVQ